VGGHTASRRCDKAIFRTLVRPASWSHADTERLDDLLDPNNDKVQLDTIQRATLAVGRKLHLELT
jgi:hypothetical protein